MKPIKNSEMQSIKKKTKTVQHKRKQTKIILSDGIWTRQPSTGCAAASGNLVAAVGRKPNVEYIAAILTAPRLICWVICDTRCCQKTPPLLLSLLPTYDYCQPRLGCSKQTNETLRLLPAVHNTTHSSVMSCYVVFRCWLFCIATLPLSFLTKTNETLLPFRALMLLLGLFLATNTCSTRFCFSQHNCFMQHVNVIAMLCSVLVLLLSLALFLIGRTSVVPFLIEAFYIVAYSRLLLFRCN